jgi:hypothetical protein
MKPISPGTVHCTLSPGLTPAPVSGHEEAE